MKKSDAKTVYDKLAELGIAYESAGHPAAFTMEDLYGVRDRLGAAFCKNLFLCNRQKTDLYLLLIREDKRFRTADVSKTLGVSRLSFAEADMLFELLGVTPGAATPMGLIFDTGHRIKLIIDRDLLALDRVCVHPCVNTESVAMSVRDLVDVFIPHCGHVPQIIDIAAAEE